MGRTITTSTPTVSLWGSVETAVRLSLSALRAPAANDPSVAMLEAEQSRIRSSGRHWLMG